MLALPFGDYRDTEQLCCDVISGGLNGGLNGGATSEEVNDAFLANTLFFIIDITEVILLLGAIGSSVLGIVMAGAMTVLALMAYIECIELYCAYLSGDMEAGDEQILMDKINAVLMVLFGVLGLVTKPIVNAFSKSKVVREYGEKFFRRVAAHFDDAADCYRFIKNLRNAGVADDVIKEAGEKYGKEGLEFTAKAKKHGVEDSIVKKILGKDSLENYTDDVLELLGKYPEYADDILDWIDRYGKKITDAIVKHGNDLIDIFVKHGDDAIRHIGNYGDTATKVIIDYGDEAVEVTNKYGKDAIDEFEIGKTPSETKKTLGNVQEYLDGIVDSSGKVNSTKLNALKNAIQNGKLGSEEIKYLSRKMNRLGIRGTYEETMKTINFKTYLTNIAGGPPANMINPHAHHILFKTGNGSEQQALVREGQAILRKYGIDPVVGEENLVWAPNGITGQHDKEALKEVVDALKAVDEAGGDYDDIVEVLKKLGIKASQRK